MAPSKTLPGYQGSSGSPQVSTKPSRNAHTMPTSNDSNEYGCPHTQAALTQDSNRYLKLYQMAVRVSLQQALLSSTVSTKPSTSTAATAKRQNGTAYGGIGKSLPGSQGNSSTSKSQLNRRPPSFMGICETCQLPNSESIACLECSYLGCLKHFTESHITATNHALGVDMAAGCEGLLYCGQCKSHIFDTQFEFVRLQKVQHLLGRGALESQPSHPAQDADHLEEAQASLPAFQATSALRGFYNMGATCFMSVIFQSLLHNPLVRNFFLAGGHEKGIACGNTNRDDYETETPDDGPQDQSSCLACALDEVFTEFYSSSSVAGFGPTNLLTASWRVKKSLAGYSEQDAHEFLQMVWNELHTSHYDSATLAQGADCSLSQMGVHGVAVPNDSRQREDVHIQHCGCISHRTFCGELESKITCQTCGTVSSTKCDPMMDLSLEIGRLPEHDTASSLAGKTVRNGFPAKSITLEECLDKFTAGETLDAHFKCEECNAKRPIQKRLSIRRLPSVLSIQLKVGFAQPTAAISY